LSVNNSNARTQHNPWHWDNNTCQTGFNEQSTGSHSDIENNSQCKPSGRKDYEFFRWCVFTWRWNGL